MNKTTNKALAAAERAWMKAHRAEQKYIGALTDSATAKQLAKGWALADATNKARIAYTTLRDAAEMVGADCFHDGEHGTVVELVTDLAVPMLRVLFGARVATLKPSEIGAR